MLSQLKFKSVIIDALMKGSVILYTVCEEHVDEALDTVVDEEDKIPMFELLTDEEKLSTVCNFCKAPAKYKIY